MVDLNKLNPWDLPSIDIPSLSVSDISALNDTTFTNNGSYVYSSPTYTSPTYTYNRVITVQHNKSGHENVKVWSYLVNSMIP